MYYSVDIWADSVLRNAPDTRNRDTDRTRVVVSRIYCLLVLLYLACSFSGSIGQQPDIPYYDLSGLVVVNRVRCVL